LKKIKIMKKINISLIALATLFMASCGSETASNEATDEKTVEEALPVEKSTEEVCNFTYDPNSTKISWKSFKTSAKVAVGGSFDTYSVDGTVASNSESAVFENATFSIVTASVNTGNTERDPKLIKFFFNTMVETDTITGGIDKISEAVDGKGAAIIHITMNGQSHEENASYTLEGTVLTLSATINMAKWEASNAITALNTECKDLHTGDDGISKLWEEVEIEITTNLAKDCN
jgi:polyisoprenoid-binding protein YceI